MATVESGILDEDNITGGRGETVPQRGAFTLIEAVVNDAIEDRLDFAF